MNALDIKLNEAFPGKVVRKDLLHEIKRAVNVPSFVLEFLFILKLMIMMILIHLTFLMLVFLKMVLI